mmetsp:Transcript_8991/g.26120  ORF Transcript_8991/g.26120 Transcript_8991/m.26120 type:complete len:212 (+) Transcript_8991:9105-9740(+)
MDRGVSSPNSRKYVQPHPYCATVRPSLFAQATTSMTATQAGSSTREHQWTSSDDRIVLPRDVSTVCGRPIHVPPKNLLLAQSKNDSDKAHSNEAPSAARRSFSARGADQPSMLLRLSAIGVRCVAKRGRSAWGTSSKPNKRLLRWNVCQRRHRRSVLILRFVKGGALSLRPILRTRCGCPLLHAVSYVDRSCGRGSAIYIEEVGAAVGAAR